MHIGRSLFAPRPLLVRSRDRMAAAVVDGNRILRETIKRSVLRTLFAVVPGCWNSPQGAKRYLLTEDVLRLQGFQQQKLATKYRIYGKKDTYFRMIEEKLSENRLILRDELKILLHLCETKDDIEIAKRVIYRYHAENKNVAFAEFKFGPLFMRLCYELDLEESAFELIKDQALRGFFSDTTSFNILMDLLFAKGHYERALEVLLEMKRQGVKFNQETYLLAFALCYKLNSSESCKMCTTLLEDGQLRGDHLPRKGYYFAVAFALKQIMDTETRICSNLKILLQAASGNLEDVVQTLETALESNTSDFVKKTEFCMQVLTTAREKLEENLSLCARFEAAFTKLQALGQTTSLTLDDLLCQTPPTKRRHLQLLKHNQVSRRTLRPLRNALLTE
ncbi:pentatricopeptide repeat-containing protein 2, mitochondrial isoform X2 [Hemicordylus capensis]|uniref:pentatricopeptide repeat-containing protein 2, mitochondrial isoform X2 n=1 Tax=Hemicordylus capensis TaxID=884348 RepID=UPI0023031211|nr:pentatricopeptide repeat-containing protein 2, mitochondrial isoform X2 [Hemicordylus capensis]